MSLETKTPGRIAFEAYNEAKGGLTHDGKPIPPWTDVGAAVREAWEAAAYAVLRDGPRRVRAEADDTAVELLRRARGTSDHATLSALAAALEATTHVRGMEKP